MFLLACSTASGAANGPILWLAESKGLLKLAAFDGSLLFEIPIYKGVDNVAVDPESGDVWSHNKKRLRAHSSEGTLRVDELTPLKGGKLTDMVVGGGGLWLAQKKALFQFDLLGQLLQKLKHSKNIEALTIDPVRSRFWVATKEVLTAYDADGNEVLAVIQDTAGRAEDDDSDSDDSDSDDDDSDADDSDSDDDGDERATIQQIAWDGVIDQLWVVLKETMRRYDAGGSWC